MTEERQKDLLQAIEETRGASAIIWSYTASHDELTIRVEWPSKGGNLHFVCSGCRRLEATSSWRDVAFLFEELEEGFFALEDKTAGFRVICGMIRILRDVEPIFDRGKK